MTAMYPGTLAFSGVMYLLTRCLDRGLFADLLSIEIIKSRVGPLLRRIIIQRVEEEDFF